MKVFLSHSHKDHTLVARLAADLQRAGLQVWYAEWEMKPGDSLVRKIAQGVATSGVLIVVLSPASVRSSWVEKEISLGLIDELARASTRVIPILVEDCEFPASFRALGDKIYADFRSDYESALRRLLAGIGVRPSRRGLKAFHEHVKRHIKVKQPGAITIAMWEGMTTVWEFDRLTNVVSLHATKDGEESQPLLEIPLTAPEATSIQGFRRKDGWGYYDVIAGAGVYRAMIQIAFFTSEWEPRTMRWLLDRAAVMRCDYHGTSLLVLMIQSLVMVRRTVRPRGSDSPCITARSPTGRFATAGERERYTDGEFRTRTLECAGGLQLRVGPGKGRSES